MSETGDTNQVVWVIRLNPDEEASLFAMPVGDSHLGIFLFTHHEYAAAFSHGPDVPRSAVITYVAVTDLPRVLTEQQNRGRTHVVTDPIIGATAAYLGQHTLSITEYLKRLGN